MKRKKESKSEAQEKSSKKQKTKFETINGQRVKLILETGIPDGATAVGGWVETRIKGKRNRRVKVPLSDGRPPARTSVNIFDLDYNADSLPQLIKDRRKR